MDLRQKLMLSPLYDWLGKRSYAQSGEDLIAWAELSGERGWIPDQVGNDNIRDGNRGFYVDVGAYHPKLFSNTYLFYKKGWKGICIDPNPEMAPLFAKARPRDIFLNMGVGDVDGVRLPRFGVPKLAMTNKKSHQVTEMEYFEFEDGAANTFSEEQSLKNQQEAGRKLKGKRMMTVMPLKTILEKYLPKGQKIDLLSVDVEGMDEVVLSSNDWKKFRPEIIVAEDLSFDFDKPKKSGVVKLLMEKGYRLTAKTPYSLIFRVVK